MTLLGDAAHPMYPVGSNGASQAILDARVLCGCLRSKQPVVAALRAYEQVRLPATAALTLANRKQGPEECMTLVEARAPNGFERIEDVITEAELQAIAAKYKRLAGFSIDELNQRPSLAHVQY
jgi:2-polyprenyl-6-methoxyphenol hydroxylase-like FAD-dependent oxidoreductase